VEKNNPSYHRTIMNSLVLAKLNGIIQEKKISSWLESYGKMAKDHVGFKIYHSIVDHLITLRIIVEVC
jgi:hypothetical protein